MATEKTMTIARRNPPTALPDRRAVSMRLVAIRKALGLGPSQLADVLQIDRGSWTKIEQCKRDLSLANAWRLYQFFGFSLDFIFDGKIGGIPAEHRDAVLANLNLRG